MHLKLPGGKVWHVGRERREAVSLCGAVSMRPSFFALFAPEAVTRDLPLCRNCERLAAGDMLGRSARSA